MLHQLYLVPLTAVLVAKTPTLGVNQVEATVVAVIQGVVTAEGAIVEAKAPAVIQMHPRLSLVIRLIQQK